MNPALYFAMFFPLIIVLLTQRRNRSYLAAKLRKKKGSNTDMLELAKEFIGKDCIVYLVSGGNAEGIIQKVSGNALMVEKNGNLQAVNLDFVTQIREYPRNKNGKKKSLVLD